jgi:hypothetical protein
MRVSYVPNSASACGRLAADHCWCGTVLGREPAERVARPYLLSLFYTRSALSFPLA